MRHIRVYLFTYMRLYEIGFEITEKIDTVIVTDTIRASEYNKNTTSRDQRNSEIEIRDDNEKRRQLQMLPLM